MKQPSPVKAWAVVTDNGIHEDMVFHTRAKAIEAKGDWNEKTDRVIQVWVTPITPRSRK